MKIKARQAHILLAIMLALLAIVVPYLIAWRISPAGTVFTGFLLNPIDGFSYLAKMRQGFDGAWRFQLAYASDPGAGTFLFIFYLGLGHLSRILNAPLIVTFHAARITMAVGFFVLLYLFFDQVFEDERLKRAGFLLSLFGSGLGWLALLVLGLQTIDLLVPEAIPFLSAYTNPHFPLAGSAFIGAVLVVFEGNHKIWWHRLLAVICGIIIGAVLPFITIPLFLVLGLWLLWDFIKKRNSPLSSYFMGAPLSLLLVVLGSAPFLVYDFWISINHPVISEWNAQNLTPSPPLVETILGYSPALLFALISLFKRPWQSGPAGRLLTTWLLVGFTLLYIPLPFQRRLSMGLYLPITALTVWWFDQIFKSQGRFRLAYASLLILTIPSILTVILAGVLGVASRSEVILFNAADLEAYTWIRDRVPPDTVILTDPKHGNRLPAFAPVRVLYGHPFETPNAEFWQNEVQSLLSWREAPDDGIHKLDQHEVSWVLLDQSASTGDAPSWWQLLNVRLSVDGLTILEKNTQ